MGIIKIRKKASKKRAGGAQRKELVNGIANKPKGKDCGNWARKAQRI